MTVFLYSLQLNDDSLRLICIAGVTLNGTHEVGVQHHSVKVELDDDSNPKHFKPGLPYRGQVATQWHRL